MSIKKYHCYDKCLYKEIGPLRIYLYKSWDLVHGYGWFCHIYKDIGKMTFGFSRNKFSAVKIALCGF